MFVAFKEVEAAAQACHRDLQAWFYEADRGAADMQSTGKPHRRERGHVA